MDQTLTLAFSTKTFRGIQICDSCIMKLKETQTQQSLKLGRPRLFCSHRRNGCLQQKSWILRDVDENVLLYLWALK